MIVGEPLVQGGGDFFRVGGDDDAYAGVGDFLADVDVIGDEDGGAGGEGFDDGYAEIFVVAGEGEEVGILEGGDAILAFEHAGEADPVDDVEGFGEGLHLCHVVFGVGADDGEDGGFVLHPGQGGEEVFDAFAGVDSAEEDDERVVGDSWM